MFLNNNMLVEAWSLLVGHRNQDEVEEEAQEKPPTSSSSRAHKTDNE